MGVIYIIEIHLIANTKEMDQTSLFAGLDLVFSNVIFLVVAAKAFEMGYFMECCIMAVLGFTSTFYHLCQAQFFCIDSLHNHQIMDHFFVYSSLTWMLLFFLDTKIVPRVCVFIIAQSVLLPTIIRWIGSWALAGAIIFGLIVIAVVILFYNDLPKFDPWDLAFALVLLIIGFALHIIAGDPGDSQYPPWHSLWHLCAGMSAYFVVTIRDGQSEISKFLKKLNVHSEIFDK
jgi:hypothetical protein